MKELQSHLVIPFLQIKLMLIVHSFILGKKEQKGLLINIRPLLSQTAGGLCRGNIKYKFHPFGFFHTGHVIRYACCSIQKCYLIPVRLKVTHNCSGLEQ